MVFCVDSLFTFEVVEVVISRRVVVVDEVKVVGVYFGIVGDVGIGGVIYDVVVVVNGGLVIVVVVNGGVVIVVDVVVVVVVEVVVGVVVEAVIGTVIDVVIGKVVIG